MAWHYLRENKGNTYPHDLIFVDCEGKDEPIAKHPDNQYAINPTISKLWFGYAEYIRLEKLEATREESLYFENDTQFWMWRAMKARKKSCQWIFAHNQGYDATVLKFWERLDDGTFTFITSDCKECAGTRRIGKKACEACKGTGFAYRNGVQVNNGMFVVDDPPTIVEVQDQFGNRFKLIDTLNYFRMSLAQLGEALSEYKGIFPSRLDSLEVWKEYCKQDVRVIREAILGLIRFVKENDLGNFRYTIASLSMSAFRHRFMRHRILLHDNNAVKRLERKGYYGGQVEVYWHPEVRGRVFQLDVNSLYPSVMRDNLFPTALLDWCCYSPGSTGKILNLGRSGVAEVRVKTDTRTYPVRLQEGVFYARGDFWTTLCGPELEYALQSGHVQEMSSWAIYKLEPIFTEFIDFFWNKRKEYQRHGNKVYDWFCKITMNSNYGRWALRGAKWETMANYPVDQKWTTWQQINIDTKEAHWYRAIGERVERKVIEGDHPHSSPIVSAFITAYARERMRLIREPIPFGSLFYQGVDSVYVDNKGYHTLLKNGECNDGELGKLKLESTAEGGRFIGINHYHLGEKRVIGAIKSCRTCRGSRAIPTYPGSNHKKMCPDCSGRGVPLPDRRGRYKQTAFQHLSSILTNPLQGGVIISTVYKTRTSEYNRGIKCPNGMVLPRKLKISDNGTVPSLQDALWR